MYAWQVPVYKVTALNIYNSLSIIVYQSQQNLRMSVFCSLYQSSIFVFAHALLTSGISGI